MSGILLATAMAMTATAAMAGTENLTVNNNNGFDAAISTTATTGSGTATDNGNGTFTVTLSLDGFTAPDFFLHGPSSSGHATIGFNLGGLAGNGLAINSADVTIAPTLILFTDAGPVTVTNGSGLIGVGNMDGRGSFGYGIDCLGNCQPASTHVTGVQFTIGDSIQGGLSIANLVANGNGNILGLDVWSDQGGGAPTGYAGVQLSAAVPQPATWAMMLLGFAGLGFAFRQTRRKISFA